MSGLESTNLQKKNVATNSLRFFLSQTCMKLVVVKTHKSHRLNGKRKQGLGKCSKKSSIGFSNGIRKTR
jgi:hypothetical protein